MFGSWGKLLQYFEEHKNSLTMLKLSPLISYWYNNQKITRLCQAAIIICWVHSVSKLDSYIMSACLSKLAIRKFSENKMFSIQLDVFLSLYFVLYIAQFVLIPTIIYNTVQIVRVLLSNLVRFWPRKMYVYTKISTAYDWYHL